MQPKRSLIYTLAVLITLLLFGTVARATTIDVIVTFDYPGSTFTSMNGINRKGYICGRYLDASGIEHGFTARAVSTSADDAGMEGKGNIPSLPGPVRKPSAPARLDKVPAS